MLKERLQRLSELEIICSDDVRHRTFFLQMRPNVLKVAVSVLTFLSPTPSHPVCFLPTLQSYTLRYQFCFGATISLRPIQCHLLMCCSYEIKRWTIPPSSDPKSKPIQAAVYRLPKTTQTSVKGCLLWMVEYGCACGCAIDGKNKRWEILETPKKVSFFTR